MHDRTDGVYDVGIVGGGPAGLSAAIFLGRYLHSVVLVDSGDPRNWETRGVNGFLGNPHIRPAELRAAGRAECAKYDVALVDAIVDRVQRLDDETFEIALDDGRRFRSRRFVLAIGLRDVWPDLPGLERVYGRNAHVCPDCDGYECRELKTVVVGKGRKAVGLALNLTTWTSRIVICTNGADPELDEPEYVEKLTQNRITVITECIQRVTTRADGGIYSLELAGGKCLDADKIFFSLGQHAADDLGAQLGCERDADGQVVVDTHRHTSVQNVWAVGDITPGPQLAVAAAADGAVAALSIHKSLVPESRKLKPRK
ncbi:MAG TPA: NAD(P)/FAD-dependent oxidoreductase [Gemmatimonadaceae bacterium]|nr:NAD(P)/FAD-dependent oxidoreductase [Gemmatimonadaceae bacterium]